MDRDGQRMIGGAVGVDVDVDVDVDVEEQQQTQGRKNPLTQFVVSRASTFQGPDSTASNIDT